MLPNDYTGQDSACKELEPNIAVEKSKLDIQRPALKSENLCLQKKCNQHIPGSQAPPLPLVFVILSPIPCDRKYKSCCIKHRYAIFLWSVDFIPFEYSGSKIARSYDRSTFSFLKKLFNVSHNGCIAGNNE